MKQNSCKVNEKKTIPGINACKSDIKPKNIDNRILAPETLTELKKRIKGNEGYKLNAYRDTGGVLTIGYGHTKDVYENQKITREEAEKLFNQDVLEHIDALKHVKVQLSENQKLALADLIFNIGGTKFYRSELLKKLNAGDIEGAAKELEGFIFDRNKNAQNGLIERRKNDIELFLKDD